MNGIEDQTEAETVASEPHEAAPFISLLARTIEMEEPTTIEYALKLMTDDWIDNGEYSAQTVFDLRDALRQAILLVRKPERDLAAMTKERDSYRASYDGAAEALRIYRARLDTAIAGEAHWKTRWASEVDDLRRQVHALERQIEALETANADEI